MKGNNFAFEQVECKYPRVREEVRQMGAESTEWIIEYDGMVRETWMVGMAWYAKHFDDEATVEPA